MPAALMYVRATLAPRCRRITITQIGEMVRHPPTRRCTRREHLQQSLRRTGISLMPDGIQFIRPTNTLIREGVLVPSLLPTEWRHQLH